MTPFDGSAVDIHDLAELAADCGAAVHRDRVEAAASRVRRLRLDSGARMDYDALVVATCARAGAGVPGAITFRDQRDAHLVRGLVGGATRRVVFAACAGVSWTFSLYELALMTGETFAGRESATEVGVVMPEAEPLELFGPAAAAHVAGLLVTHGVNA